MSCEVCGLSGLHSCPGYWLELPTQEGERKLQEVIYKIFGEVEDNIAEDWSIR